MHRLQTVFIDQHHLAGFDITHVFRADDIERTGLGRQYPRFFEPPQDKRPDAMRVAYTDKGVIMQGDQ